MIIAFQITLVVVMFFSFIAALGVEDDKAQDRGTKMFGMATASFVIVLIMKAQGLI